MNRTKWEYLWRETYWTETARTENYGGVIGYDHFWKYDLSGEEPPEQFPSDRGLDYLGRDGWELVAILPGSKNLLTEDNPQKGPIYSQFPVYTLIFKRPLVD